MAVHYRLEPKAILDEIIERQTDKKREKGEESEEEQKKERGESESERVTETGRERERGERPILSDVSETSLVEYR